MPKAFKRMLLLGLALLCMGSSTGGSLPVLPTPTIAPSTKREPPAISATTTAPPAPPAVAESCKVDAPTSDPLIVQLALAADSFEQAYAAASHQILTNCRFHIQSVDKQAAAIATVLDVQTEHRLTYNSAADHPVVKADQRYFEQYQSSLTPAQVRWAEDFMATYRQGVQNEIDHPHGGTDALKVVAALDAAGHMMAGSVQVFEDQGVHGRAWLLGTEVLSHIRTPEQIEAEAYNGFGPLIKRVAPKATDDKPPATTASSAPAPDLTAHLVLYQSDALGIRISVPESFEKLENAQAGAPTLHLRFATGEITISRSPQTPGKSLQVLGQEKIDANTKASAGRVVSKDLGPQRVGGQAAWGVQYFFDSAAGRFDSRMDIVLAGGSEYRVSCQTKQGPPVVPWETVQPVCDLVLGTLTFLPVSPSGTAAGPDAGVIITQQAATSVITEYFAALGKRDFPTAYGLMSASFRRGITPPDLARNHIQAATVISVNPYTYLDSTFHVTTTPTNRAAFRVVVDLKLAGVTAWSPGENQRSVGLVWEDGQLKIDSLATGP